MRIASNFLRLCCACVAMTGLLSACASYPRNDDINKISPEAGYRYNALAASGNTESLFVILTFSGGGTRAGALSYGVLDKLRKTHIVWKGRKKTLLSEVDVISSVSGGSFTAAYYGLNRDGIFAARSDPRSFKNRFLYRNLESDLLAALLNPVNWPRLASPTFGRIDLAAELYNDTIFDGKSFVDLSARGRPFFMINATDMSKGVVFPFIQDRFDYLCSSLDNYKIGRAVAASSNFPVAFSPLTVNSYAQQCAYPKPTWIRQAEKDGAFWINPRRFNKARTTWTYRDHKDHPFVHLLDGGVGDNIGLRGPLTALQSNDLPWSLPNKINEAAREMDRPATEAGKKDGVEKIVVIIVDAKSYPTVTFDKKASPPGLFKVVNTIATVPLDNYSFDTVERLSNVFKQWRRDRQKLWKDSGQVFKRCPPPPDNRKKGQLSPLDLYAVYVGFDQINDAAERKRFFNMATSFDLPESQVNDLIAIGPKLMDQSPDFAALAKCLK